MYLGRKANPVANKFLFEVELKKKQDSHRRRVASMQPSVNTKPPVEHRHLYRNAKREQLMEGACEGDLPLPLPVPVLSWSSVVWTEGRILYIV